MGHRHCFKGARRRRADSDDAPPLGHREIDLPRSAFPNLVVFGLEPMIFDVVDTYGLKRAVPYVQRDIDTNDASGLECGQKSVSQVETGRRCRNRPSLLCIDRLVPISIGCEVHPLDVGRQGNMADRVDGVLDR